MAELHFSTDRIKAETNGMADLAEKFLERGQSQQLRDAAHGLSRALASGGIWQISRHHPLETSAAEREAGMLFGRLSFKWEVRSINRETFSVTGNASTTIEIHDLERNSALISWNTDIGGSGHPGYRLHVQFRLHDESVEIPRLPSFLLTPVDCLDFLLGELFQDEWKRHQYENHLRTARWTQYVRKRVCHLLRTKAECAEQARGITPWMTLKSWTLRDPRLTLGDD